MVLDEVQLAHARLEDHSCLLLGEQTRSELPPFSLFLPSSTLRCGAALAGRDTRVAGVEEVGFALAGRDETCVPWSARLRLSLGTAEGTAAGAAGVGAAGSAALPVSLPSQARIL